MKQFSCRPYDLLSDARSILYARHLYTLPLPLSPIPLLYFPFTFVLLNAYPFRKWIVQDKCRGLHEQAAINVPQWPYHMICRTYFLTQFLCKAIICTQRTPKRLEGNRRLYEHVIYIRHCQESNPQPVPSQVRADPTRPQWRTYDISNLWNLWLATQWKHTMYGGVRPYRLNPLRLKKLCMVMVRVWVRVGVLFKKINNLTGWFNFIRHRLITIHFSVWYT